MKDLIQELDTLRTLEGEARESKCEEIAAHFTSEEDRAVIQRFLDEELDSIGNDLDRVGESLERIEQLKKQLEDMREIIPFKYIAKHYFGKSAAWLSQRINGSEVRGQRYTLKPNEIEIFNNALHDIGLRLGSFSIG